MTERLRNTEDSVLVLSSGRSACTALELLAQSLIHEGGAGAAARRPRYGAGWTLQRRSAAAPSLAQAVFRACVHE